MVTAVLWFRRDLRLRDNPALLAAADGADTVVPLFVVDPALWGPAGARRRAHLAASLRSLDADLDGSLLIRRGDPVQVVPDLAAAVRAPAVHIAADHQPQGRVRDGAVERALADRGVRLVRTGSPYVVAPGRLARPDGSPFTVYSPWYRAWLRHGWRSPAADPVGIRWIRPDAGDPVPDDPAVPGLPPAGERAAREVWRRFLAADGSTGGVAAYAASRDRPDLAGTTRLSVHLKFGELHPRTVLADLAALVAADPTARAGAEALRGELAWRDFYADVLFHRPDSARTDYRPELAGMRWDTGPDAHRRLAAWQQGRTGYPVVDAGMRQLLAEGWMHNRLRMVVASFLVKDLHLAWPHGARWFMHQLVDGELSSNSHGWQWVAGSGTDAAAYHRVFNPTLQGQRFDPAGDYVRRYVPELRHVAGADVHTPWAVPGGYDHGYPEPLVDHAAERRESLSRLAELRG